MAPLNQLLHAIPLGPHDASGPVVGPSGDDGLLHGSGQLDGGRVQLGGHLGIPDDILARYAAAIRLDFGAAFGHSAPVNNGGKR